MNAAADSPAFRQTRPARPVPARYAREDQLPRLTPVVGDEIQYTNGGGDPVLPARALELLRDGKPVLYTTWERL